MFSDLKTNLVDCVCLINCCLNDDFKRGTPEFPLLFCLCGDSMVNDSVSVEGD